MSSCEIDYQSLKGKCDNILFDDDVSAVRFMSSLCPIKPDFKNSRSRIPNFGVKYAKLLEIRAAGEAFKDVERLDDYVEEERSFVSITKTLWFRPPKQTAYGEFGLCFTFADVTVEAKRNPRKLIYIVNTFWFKKSKQI